MGLLGSRFNAMQSGLPPAVPPSQPQNDGVGVFGPTSTESFANRRSVNARREHINNYRSAGVIHSYRNLARKDLSASARVAPATSEPAAAAPYRPMPKQSRRPTGAADSPVVVKPAAAVPRAAYADPPSRGYNPFA